MLGPIYRISRKVQRALWSKRVKKRAGSYGTGLKANYRTDVTGKTFLGNNVNFNGMRITGSGKVSIGDNFHSGSGCQIITSFHDYDNDEYIPYGTHMINKDVVIEDNVWLGNNVIVLGGVYIGEGAIIQAGSVVCKDVPKYSIAGGHPAIPFKMRDVEHYERLKAEGKFC